MMFKLISHPYFWVFFSLCNLGVFIFDAKDGKFPEVCFDIACGVVYAWCFHKCNTFKGK